MMLKALKRMILNQFLLLVSHIGLFENLDRIVISQSLTHARENRKKEKIESLSDIEFRGYSQWGEDGILDWLIEKIPGIPQTFVEFGVENYRQSNTRLLLWLRNWRGLVIDGSENHINNIRKQDVSWRFNLSSTCAFINRDNINQLISNSGIVGDIGVLSVDIDGNDYWVWEAIQVVNPVIVVCEYNAVFGDLHSISVPYDPLFQISKAHHSNLYYGASIKALIRLGAKKGYKFVGTCSNGCNAFFVRDDRAHEILERLGNISIMPSRFRTSRDELGSLTFISGTERTEVIKHLPVFEFESGNVVPISACGKLYSDEWGGS